MTLLKAFLVGGALCALAQGMVDTTKINSTIGMVSAVSTDAILSGLGLYGPLISFAGAGASIPLFGFGHTLVTGIDEGEQLIEWFEFLTGGPRATAPALTAAIVFGYIMAIPFSPKG